MSHQTGFADSLTCKVLSVGGDGDHAAFLLRLLEGEATARQLCEPPSKKNSANKYLRRKLSQSTGNRNLGRLGDVGLTVPGQKPSTYRLAHPQETRSFLEAANRLALAIGQTRLSEDEALSRSMNGGGGADGQAE